ncbi:hypothetical protein RND71_027717 [Anisodus tanguticus]|uniref:F-box domain-containing protein n=1 Tax=Anisodus tanguticus TaxID=243964 RepID=A0AAE1RH43_9SOLA|nr:hypothetical protein RND71_027717 [Anisodus tanguticus]
MANTDEIHTISLSFNDFPEDVQLNILSFLTPSDISNFACTSKRFVSLCRDAPKLWFSMCQRQFGSKTLINKWGNGGLSEKAMNLDDSGFVAENELLVPVNVNFMGKNHVVEENGSAFGYSCNVSSSGNVTEEEYEDLCGSPGSLPDRLMSEIYQCFSNRTSPGGNGSTRRQRRREREMHGRRKWEPQDYVKIVNCSPTPAKPLQGLWKFPLSSEEESIYEGRMHIQPLAEADDPCEIFPSSDYKAVLSMLCMNSSYDLVIPDLAGSTVNPRQAEGRIWQYENGSFGFGFLRDHYVIDLRHIALNGQILDARDLSGD